jgi:hypothetical protein
MTQKVLNLAKSLKTAAKYLSSLKFAKRPKNIAKFENGQKNLTCPKILN